MAATGALPSILQTKLFRPPLIEDYVPRPQLRERLEQVGRCPLTLVCAPAGYGKSVLMSAWLEQCGCHGAWLSVDENDNDLAFFVSYVLAALRGEIPSFGEELVAMLDGASLPPTPVLVEVLFNELSQLESDIFLVIDDYDVITNNAVHEFITELMRHPHPRLHLVLGMRHEPPLPINEWRTRIQLVEIRSADLRFSIEETASFIRLALDEQISDETIVVLYRKIEGWVAGLRLVVLSFSRIEGFRRHVEALGGNNVYIKNYLASQVLSRLPAEKQLFLLMTSILDRLSASLCQAVIMLEDPIINTQATLLELEAANVFIIPLDDSQQWYRYHHLFDEFLQMRLHEGYSSEIVAELNGRASAWFAEHGFIEEALKHALAAGNMEAAVQLVAANRMELLNLDHYQRLTHWLHMFPERVIDESPDLLLIQARFAQIQRFDMTEVSHLVEKVDSLVHNLQLESKRAQRLLAENDTLRCAKQYFSLDAQSSLAGCRKVLEVLPIEFYSLRSYCWIYGAVALQMMGDPSGAYEWIERGRREDLMKSGGPQARNSAAAGFVSWIAADLTQMQSAGEIMLRILSDRKLWHTRGWAHYFLACVHYHRNDLDNALHHAQQTFDHRYLNQASASVYSAFILTLIQQARGNPDEALEMLALVSDYAVEICSPTLTLMVQHFDAELAVMQGRAREVNQWAKQTYAQLQLTAMPFFYAPPLTIPKVLLAEGTPDGQAMAGECLQRLHEFAESTHNVRVMIEVLALKALLLTNNNDEEAALATLGESLALAKPGGFVRLYVDLGPEMAGLLRRLQNREPIAEFVASILKAFADASNLAAESKGNRQLIEPLTVREAEILELLANRYSNKEIAAELVISPATVNRHTINLYKKLSVHSRREAVLAARALGLIPSL